jgi:Uma2 family endonuclease
MLVTTVLMVARGTSVRSSPAATERLSVAEYLEWEGAQPRKHEYHLGAIFATAGGSTEAYDRGEKWDAYQRLPSLTDYVLVSQTAKSIEHYQREADGSWRYGRLEGGDSVTLSNGAAVAVDAVYEGAFELVGD